MCKNLHLDRKKNFPHSRSDDDAIATMLPHTRKHISDDIDDHSNPETQQSEPSNAVLDTCNLDCALNSKLAH
jgi:hypothetical protein